MLYTYDATRGTFVQAPQELDEVQFKLRGHSIGDVYVKINGSNLLKKRVNTEDKRWTEEEEKLVHHAMRTVDKSLENRWETIADMVPTRSREEVFERMVPLHSIKTRAFGDFTTRERDTCARQRLTDLQRHRDASISGSIAHRFVTAAADAAKKKSMAGTDKSPQAELETIKSGLVEGVLRAEVDTSTMRLFTDQMKLSDLQIHSQIRGLSTQGTKHELSQRLEEYMTHEDNDNDQLQAAARANRLVLVLDHRLLIPHAATESEIELLRLQHAQRENMQHTAPPVVGYSPEASSNMSAQEEGSMWDPARRLFTPWAEGLTCTACCSTTANDFENDKAQMVVEVSLVPPPYPFYTFVYPSVQTNSVRKLAICFVMSPTCLPACLPLLSISHRLHTDCLTVLSSLSLPLSPSLSLPLSLPPSLSFSPLPPSLPPSLHLPPSFRNPSTSFSPSAERWGERGGRV